MKSSPSPIDRNGVPIEVGEKVKTTTIPDSLLRGLPKEDQAAIQKQQGADLSVSEIDNRGYVWVEVVESKTEEEYSSRTFSLEPLCLEVIPS